MRFRDQDTERLSLLLKQADQSLDEAINRLNQTQLDGSKERTQYFEKLAIGSGAAIAAIVSFIGTRAGGLQPAWILRCSLVALVVALTAALYRNLRYPSYVLAVYNRLWIEASRHQQQCKNDLFQAQPGTISLQSGDPIDLEEWKSDFNKSDAGLEVLVRDRLKRENRLLKEFKCAEYVCLSSISVSMISLVCLALRNF
jgi:hypothetical protein